MLRKEQHYTTRVFWPDEKRQPNARLASAFVYAISRYRLQDLPARIRWEIRMLRGGDFEIYQKPIQ